MTKDDYVYSYKSLKELINNTRGGEPKLTGNTTARFLDDGRLAIRLYWTDIIIIDSNDQYELRTNGHTENTTLSRLNGFSPARVVKRQGEFFLLKDYSAENHKKKNLIPFFDGIKVDRYGDIIPQAPDNNITVTVNA